MCNTFNFADTVRPSRANGNELLTVCVRMLFPVLHCVTCLNIKFQCFLLFHPRLDLVGLDWTLLLQLIFHVLACTLKQPFWHTVTLKPKSPSTYLLYFFFSLSLDLSVHTGTLLANLIACLSWFAVDGDRGVDFGLSILWLLLFTPCSFVCWYRPLYAAFR